MASVRKYSGKESLLEGCGFLAYSWKLPAYNGAFLLTHLKILAFLLTVGAVLQF